MKKVETKPLPHKVGNASVANPELKTVVMQFMENFLSIGGQLKTVQEAVRELQGRKVVSPEIEDIETYVSRAESAASTATAAKGEALSAANDAATAKNDAVSAKNDAVSAKTAAETASGNASGYATSASGSAGNAAGSATAASGSAEAAAQSAAQAQSAAETASFFASFAMKGLDLGSSAERSKFLMSGLVPDTSKGYSVTVTFLNEAATSRSCTVQSSTDSDPQTVSLAGTAGASASATISVPGNGYFAVDNITATVTVFVKIALSAQGGGT